MCQNFCNHKDGLLLKFSQNKELPLTKEPVGCLKPLHRAYLIMSEKVGPMKTTMEKMCIFITKAPARLPKVQDMWTVPAPKPSWKKQSEKKGEPGAHKPEVNPTILDEQDGEEMKAEAPAHNPRARSQPQRERSRSAKKASEKPDDTESRSRSPLKSRKTPKDIQPATEPQPQSFHTFAFDLLQAIRAGWARIDKGGQGDCGYRVLCCGLEGKEINDSDIARKVGVLRSEVIGHIRKHYARYAKFYAPSNSSEPATPQEWLDKAKDPSFWIEGMQLQAVCEKKEFHW